MGKSKFYAVRRGRKPGIYATWEECQKETAGFSGSEFKGFSTLQEAEQFMGSSPSKATQRLYVLDGGVSKAKARTEELTGSSSSSRFLVLDGGVDEAKARAQPEIQDDFLEELLDTIRVRKKLENCGMPSGFQASPQELYELHFDGAAKGNPGKAGAGALLRKVDGTVVCELSEGLGSTTNNVAEYRGLVMGLRAALDMGVSRIFVRGDSKLVCEQLMGRWKVKNENLEILWKEAMYLKSKFLEFRIEHVLRGFNPQADALANVGVTLPETSFVSICPPDFDPKKQQRIAD